MQFFHNIYRKENLFRHFFTTLSFDLYLPRQAYPAADEARPAAVGKLFSEHICM